MPLCIHFVSILRSASVEGTGKFVPYNEVSLYRGSFSYILLLLGQRKSFVIPRTSLNRGSLYRGFVISRFFFICFTMTGVMKIVRYTEDFVI